MRSGSGHPPSLPSCQRLRRLRRIPRACACPGSQDIPAVGDRVPGRTPRRARGVRPGDGQALLSRSCAIRSAVCASAFNRASALCWGWRRFPTPVGESSGQLSRWSTRCRRSQPLHLGQLRALVLVPPIDLTGRHVPLELGGQCFGPRRSLSREGRHHVIARASRFRRPQKSLKVIFAGAPRRSRRTVPSRPCERWPTLLRSAPAVLGDELSYGA